MLRWDQRNLRTTSTISFPFKSKAATRLSLNADWRKEEWDLSQSIEGPLFAAEFLELSRTKAGVELKCEAGSRWSWFNGATVSKVDFNDSPESIESTHLFSPGWTLEYFAGIQTDLVRLPQKRFKIEASTTVSIAKKFGIDSFRFGKFESRILTQWFPKSKGDDFLTCWKVSLGKGFGDVPF